MENICTKSRALGLSISMLPKQQSDRETVSSFVDIDSMLNECTLIKYTVHSDTIFNYFVT